MSSVYDPWPDAASKVEDYFIQNTHYYHYPMTSRFDDWAEIYDSVYSYMKDDVAFYVEEASSVDGPVLELGCGTGRVSIPMAGTGSHVVGLDSSHEMLLKACGKVDGVVKGKGSISLIRGDMRELPFGQLFSLIVVPFRGFLSLLSVEAQERTLNEIRTHLAPGGRLVFNVFVPDLNMLVQEGDVPYHFRDVTDPQMGTTLVLWHQSSYDNYNQIISVRLIVEELDAGGAVRTRVYRDFQLRYVFRWEMHRLLESCGFRVLDLYGDFDRSPFDETSTEMVWVAAKAGD